MNDEGDIEAAIDQLENSIDDAERVLDRRRPWPLAHIDYPCPSCHEFRAYLAGVFLGGILGVSVTMLVLLVLGIVK